MDRRLVKLIGESLSDVVPGFDAKRFQSRASRGLKELELKDRALNIANAMAEQLPSEFDDLAPLLIRSLGPPLEATEDNGLAPFFYFPHAQLVATHGPRGNQCDSGPPWRFLDSSKKTQSYG
jgi:hypothetical protein